MQIVDHDAFLWVDKYNPQCIDDIIMPNSRRTQLKEYIRLGEIPNMLLFSSSAGTGKTSTQDCLIKELGFFDHDIMYQNASGERGMAMYEEIKQFTYTLPANPNSKHKLVVLGEFCGSKKDFQKALKEEIEGFTPRCRIIATANTPTNIDPAVLSRFQKFDFNLTNPEEQNEIMSQLMVRIKFILNSEGVEYDPNAVFTLIKRDFPDIRTIIQTLEMYSRANNKVIDANVVNFRLADPTFVELLLKEGHAKARRYMIEKNLDWKSSIRPLYDHLLPVFEANKPHMYADALHTIKIAMCDIEGYIDQEIVFADLLCQLEILIRK